MDKHLLQRRQLFWYFGLGILGAGVAATILRRNTESGLPKLSTARDVPLSGTSAPLPGQSTARDSPEVGTTPLPTRMKLPEFQGISHWLNSDPLTVADLKGNVVLIQFWTFTCINCQRTLPYITRWHQKYAAQGLSVIGVHTPEFAFEREIGNVEAALNTHQITYPVPVDNQFATWKAYNNRYWPHLFLADREGNVRYDHIGEGAYEETEQVIRQLLG